MFILDDYNEISDDTKTSKDLDQAKLREVPNTIAAYKQYDEKFKLAVDGDLKDELVKKLGDKYKINRLDNKHEELDELLANESYMTDSSLKVLIGFDNVESVTFKDIIKLMRLLNNSRSPGNIVVHIQKCVRSRPPMFLAYENLCGLSCVPIYYYEEGYNKAIGALHGTS